MESAIQIMCSVYTTASQRLQDAQPLNILCIASYPTIISMHDAGYLLKLQQPVRKILM